MRAAILAGVALAAVALAHVPSVQARTVAVRAVEMQGFGRIALTFDEPTRVSARRSGTVLVLTFAGSAAIQGERLARELPSYVSVVRRDPDGAGLRLGLTAVFRANVLEAGEKVFVDLLPESWSGLPPALPPDVVEELARRARAAEAKVLDEGRRRAASEAKPVRLRVAQLPTLLRLSFDVTRAIPATFAQDGRDVRLNLTGHLKLDESDARGRLGGIVKSLEAETADNSLGIRIALEPGQEAKGYREDDAFVVDITAANPPADAPATSGRPAPAAPAHTVRIEPERAQPQPVQAAAPARAAPVRPVVDVVPGGVRISLPFRGRAAAAAFEQAGQLTAVFQTSEELEGLVLPAGAEPFLGQPRLKREGAFLVARIETKGAAPAQLAFRDGAWVLTVGGEGLAPLQPLVPVRTIDEAGRTVLGVPLPELSGIHWLEGGEDGSRIAVATAYGGPRGVPKPQRYAEFTLLPTAQGVAVAALADDLIVRAGLDGVSVSRGTGLALSIPMTPREPGVPFTPAIDTATWNDDQGGPTLARQRGLMAVLAEAPRPARTAARLDLARFLMANGLDAEAVGVLDYALEEEPALARQRTVPVLKGIALARMRRDREARKLLSAETLADDPEALLWRAALDARSKRWPQALAGFRRASPVTDLYPDDLQGEIRPHAVRAAIALKDLAFAESELTAAGQLRLGSGPNEILALLRAALDEASGKPEATESYKRLAEGADRPVASEATLRWVNAGLADGSMTAEDAIARLETLAVTWRGGDVEIGAIARLGRLYAAAGRWRDAFSMARRANRIFPDHEETRTLHDETARLFEDLFLSGKGDSLDRVDALAIYFDFREFTPIGRRGDEIVRRLADRLVELDLLEEAGELLQHQVDKRLAGAARATVAARLATIRLMDGRPQQALAALQSSRLSELPAGIRRARMLLEARALSDLSRTDLALEVVAGETGPEIDRLRADILWTGRRWREAAEAHEALVGPRWRGQEPLSDQDRSDVIRAAIGYSLGDEALALDRLRSKFAAKMADSADAGTFGFLTRPNAAAAPGFRDIARGATRADTLADFLKEYRKRYPEAAAAPRGRPTGSEPQKPQASAGEGAAPRG